MIILQRIQTVVVTMTMIGVWTNLYVNCSKTIKKTDIK
jgi:hypothetical protein